MPALPAFAALPSGVRLGRLFAAFAPLLLVGCTVFDGEVADADSHGAAITAGEGDPNQPGGSSGAPGCTGADCVSKPGDPADPTATDHVKNGTETDIDCGGAGDIARCADGKTCKEGPDCESAVCTGGTCKPPTATDSVKNGDESDVDCGGTSTGAPKCVVGNACKAHADCATDGCGYDGKCAVARSCTAHLGGDTCGTGEVGEAGAKHGTCCASAPLPNSAAKIDKYLVTAGRMRTMIDRLNGNVRGFVGTLPAGKWNPAWNALVPANKADADEMLGSYWATAPNNPDGGASKRSCAAGDFTGRTYWTAPNGGDFSDFSKDQLDVKALNCVGWHLMNAFCAWDGARLGTRAELASAYTNGGTTTYPWQWKDNAAYTPTAQDARLNHVFSYNFPDVPGMRLSGGNALDIAYHVSPPGRNPAGWNAQGVEIAGNLLTYVGDAEYFFMWNFSWENHTDNGLAAQSWTTSAPEAQNGYYALGGRCVRD